MICSNCPRIEQCETVAEDYPKRFVGTNTEIINTARGLVKEVLEEGSCEGRVSIEGSWTEQAPECGNEFATEAKTILNAIHSPLAHGKSVEEVRQ